MKIKTNEVRVGQKLNKNIIILVPDCEDFVPEINIDFMNGDIKLTDNEKLEIGDMVLDYIWKKEITSKKHKTDGTPC